jgi:hypothetical protein
MIMQLKLIIGFSWNVAIPRSSSCRHTFIQMKSDVSEVGKNGSAIQINLVGLDPILQCRR